jgi:hypothetical protein
MCEMFHCICILCWYRETLQHSVAITFNNMEIKHRQETKFWGLHLTYNMKWDIRIENSSSTIGKSY